MRYFGILLFVSLIRISKPDFAGVGELESLLVETSQSKNIVKILAADVHSYNSSGGCCKIISRVKCLVQRRNNETYNMTLVVNELPNDSFARLVNNETGAMDIETQVYSRVVPVMEAYLRDIGDGSEPFWIQPIQTVENSSFIHQDIQQQGYKKWHQAEGLDLNECEIAVVTLAKFHALTASLLTNGKLRVDDRSLLRQPFMERLKHKTKDYYKRLYLLLVETVELWGKPWEHTPNKLKAISENITSELLSLFKEPNNSFKVVLHGSYSINNLNFKYEISDVYRSKRPISIKMDGFDTAHINSPMFDLQNFLHTSPKLGVMQTETTYLLELYIKALRTYLGRFKFEGETPSVEWLRDEYRRTNIYGLTKAINELRFFYLNKTEKPDVMKILKEAWTENREIIYNTGMLGKQYSDAMKVILMEHDIL